MAKLILDGRRISFVTEEGKIHIRPASKSKFDENEIADLLNELRGLENEPTGRKPGHEEFQS